MTTGSILSLRPGLATVIVFAVLTSPVMAQRLVEMGRVLDPQGNALPGAAISFSRSGKVVDRTTSGADGSFRIGLDASGAYAVTVNAPGFRPLDLQVNVRPDNGAIEIRMGALLARAESVTVTADINETDVLSPDPGQRVFVRQDLLDANPGRPGAPVSIPGYPIETASSGIKAPQYFAPGVAGDHGEPIAQYLAVGSYLLPNNLSANAHGNGYADPNILIPEVIESVAIEGGAFNVREGNHSVNLSATYGLRSHLDPFLTVTGDYRDIDVVAGVSPTPNSWMAFAASYGNGFLSRLEHRQQYKFNGGRWFQLGNHRLTLLGIGYYGVSYIPGLVPIFTSNSNDDTFHNYGDTIDPRQHDQTHSALVALNDVWRLSSSQQLQLSGFFRSYNLSLFSDFGQGLIRQSEFRTMAGGSADYVKKISESLSFLGGLDYEREAPRRDNLDCYGVLDPTCKGLVDPANPNWRCPFVPVASNNVTIQSVSPYVAAEGALLRYFRYYLGWRRDEIDIGNEDLLHPQDSFQKWVGVNSPKATISFLPKEAWYVPLISLSFGQAFFTEDPRIGTGTTKSSSSSTATKPGSPVATSNSYQIVASKTIGRTDIKLTLGHVTSSAELGKIDADTGLQSDEGLSRLRFMTVAVRRNLKQGSLLATFSKADARDLVSGDPTPEAPRTLFDVLGTYERLPFHLQVRGEFEFVGTKPLGNGCLPDLNAQCKGVPGRRGSAFHGWTLDRGNKFPYRGRIHGADNGELQPLRHPGSGRSSDTFLRQHYPDLQVRPIRSAALISEARRQCYCSFPPIFSLNPLCVTKCGNQRRV